MSVLSTVAVSVAAPTAPIALSPLPPSLYRLSVKQYQEMARLGILSVSDRVELLDGLLVEKITKNPPHTLATQLTREAVERPLSAGWFVNVQEPVVTAVSEPEPDVSVVRGSRRGFSRQHPQPQNVGLVVEVSDSSLALDRGWKKRIYASASIPIYWIVNLIDRQVEVYTDPTGPGDNPDYLRRQDYGPADVIPLILDGQEVARIPVSDLLP